MIPLPCPFCGASPEIGAYDGLDGSVYYIACDVKGCLVRPAVDKFSAQEAMEAWNKRA